MAKSTVLSKVVPSKKPILLLAVLGLVGLTGIGMAAFLGNSDNQTASESEAANVPMVCGYQIQNGKYSGCKIVYLSTPIETTKKERKKGYILDYFTSGTKKREEIKQREMQRSYMEDVLGVSNDGSDTLAIKARPDDEFYKRITVKPYPIETWIPGTTPVQPLPPITGDPVVSTQIGDPILATISTQPKVVYSMVDSTGTKECVPFNDVSSKKSDVWVVLSRDKKSFTRSVQEDKAAFNLGCKEVALKTKVTPPVKSQDICVFCGSNCVKASETILGGREKRSKSSMNCNTAFPVNKQCVTEFGENSSISCRVVGTNQKPVKTRMPKPISYAL